MNTSSVYGVIGNPQLPIYVASKHAVLGLTKAAALEYAKAGIRINAVAPGAIETEMMEQSIGNDKQAREALVALHPIGRAGKPEEIANAVVWLLSDKASFVTGHTLLVVFTDQNASCYSECPIWEDLRSFSSPFWGTTLGMIGNVSSSTGILILQGENDTSTPVQQAFLLQQRLTEMNHPDHTLITYPNLGHQFYPSSQWSTGIGSFEPYVLADIYAWLEAHSGLSHSYIATPTSTLGANTNSSSKK